MLRRAPNRLLSLAVLAVVLVIWFCSCTPQSKHRVLSFFFDGVPPLGSPADAGKTKTEPAVEETEEDFARPPQVAQTGSAHEPYVKRQCDRCHGSQSSMALEEGANDLCRRCHGDFTRSLNHVHGPAATFDCQVCHDPHDSEEPHLLLKPQPDLCFWCHKESDVRSAPYHAAAKDRRCSECHNPHGGDDRMFLTGGRPAAQGDPAAATGPQEN
jgi:predicted CXXCH cytochrome family protein